MKLLPTDCYDGSAWFWTGVTPDRFADTVAALHKEGESSMWLLCLTLALVLLNAAQAVAD
ncbi:DMSO/TMAO reductase YedYZ heme-binding membrane subunit [Roseovarius sp. MBR-51]